MFFARFINHNDQEHAELYHSWEQYHRDTWSPLTRRLCLVCFNINGNGYKARKQSLRDIAIEWSGCDTSGLYMSELTAILEWFSRNARRYGLIKEFHENGIC